MCDSWRLVQNIYINISIHFLKGLFLQPSSLRGLQLICNCVKVKSKIWQWFHDTLDLDVHSHACLTHARCITMSKRKLRDPGVIAVSAPRAITDQGLRHSQRCHQQPRLQHVVFQTGICFLNQLRSPATTGWDTDTNLREVHGNTWKLWRFFLKFCFPVHLEKLASLVLFWAIFNTNILRGQRSGQLFYVCKQMSEAWSISQPWPSTSLGLLIHTAPQLTVWVSLCFVVRILESIHDRSSFCQGYPLWTKKKTKNNIDCGWTHQIANFSCFQTAKPETSKTACVLHIRCLAM